MQLKVEPGQVWKFGQLSEVIILEKDKYQNDDAVIFLEQHSDYHLSIHDQISKAEFLVVRYLTPQYSSYKRANGEKIVYRPPTIYLNKAGFPKSYEWKFLGYFCDKCQNLCQQKCLKLDVKQWYQEQLSKIDLRSLLLETFHS